MSVPGTVLYMSGYELLLDRYRPWNEFYAPAISGVLARSK